MPEEPFFTCEAPSSICSTFLQLKDPTIESGAHLHTEEPPEAPSMHVKDLRAYEAPLFTHDGHQGSLKDLGVFIRTLKDLYFLECIYFFIREKQPKLSRIPRRIRDCLFERNTERSFIASGTGEKGALTSPWLDATLNSDYLNGDGDG